VGRIRKTAAISMNRVGQRRPDGSKVASPCKPKKELTYMQLIGHHCGVAAVLMSESGRCCRKSRLAGSCWPLGGQIIVLSDVERLRPEALRRRLTRSHSRERWSGRRRE